MTARMNRPENPARPSRVVAGTLRHVTITAAVAIVAAMSIPAGGRAETPAVAPPDRAAVREIVREYLLEHPEVIEEAIGVLRARREAREQRRIGAVPADGFASFHVGEGIETVLSLIAAAPKIGAAAALSAGSLGAARGPASPPRSSSPSATTSTTTSSRSVRRRCAPGSLRSSASRGVEESGVTGEVTRKRKGVMVPVINLRNEPKLRAAFEHAHVHDHTVLIDRRTKRGQQVPDRARRIARGGHRTLPRRSLAPHPRRRDRDRGTRRSGFL